MHSNVLLLSCSLVLLSHFNALTFSYVIFALNCSGVDLRWLFALHWRQNRKGTFLTLSIKNEGWNENNYWTKISRSDSYDELNLNANNTCVVSVKTMMCFKLHHKNDLQHCLNNTRHQNINPLIQRKQEQQVTLSRTRGKSISLSHSILLAVASYSNIISSSETLQTGSNRSLVIRGHIIDSNSS